MIAILEEGISKMANFPAAISNEPPPLDNSSEDEDSEEFQSHGLRLDVPSGDPTPVSTPQKKSLAKKIQSDKRSETASPQTEVSLSGSPVETEITTVVDTPVSDQVCELATGNDTGKVNGAVEVSEESDSFDSAEDKLASPEPETSQENGYMEEANHCDNDSEESIRSIPLKPEATNEPTTETEEEDKSNFQINEETNNLTADEVDAEPQDSITENEELEIVTNTAGNDLNDKDFDEFQAFESADPVVDTASSLGESGNTPTDKCPIDDDDDFDDFGAFQSIPQTTAPQPVEQSAVVAPEEEDDDDFGDFAQNSVPVPSKPTSDPTPPALFTPQDSQETTEDFADFQDCSFQSFATPPSATSDFSLIRSKIDTLVKSLFVNDEDPTEDDDVKHSSIDSEISPSSDGTWAKVQDFEGSQGLMFKWLGSLTGTRLLKSLNINTNNIVYHEKWGTIEVPKFAASLVQSPLQPQSCNKYESQGKDENPAIVNNNTILSDDHNKPPSISSEAQEILRQLPDLSYMRANTLVFPPTSPSGL